MRLRFAENSTGHNWMRRRLRVELLEARIYLHGVALDSDLAAGSRHLLASSESAWPVLVGSTIPDGISSASMSGSVVSAATYALNSVPILNSLAGAAVSLYLDFVGRFDASWGSYTNITTPAYDQDGDATTFSDGELSSIQNIWQAVAEDYAPFKINVTTVAPSSFANGVAVLIAIGGSGSWTGGTYGGVSYVDSFTNSLPNESFVFSSNLGNGYAKYVADAVSHEAGHAFGLQHQSLYGANGAKLNDYYQGPGDGTAPLMGNSYSATLSRWWYGTSTSSTTYQDDMAVLARSANGFGYRVDDHGNTAATATALTVSGNQLSGAGVITTTSDLDYFSFSTAGGQVTFSADVAAYNNLDLRLELRDAAGSLIASAAPTNSFGATITATLAAGSYRIVVASGGGYGNVGQYTVSGTIVPDVNAVYAPTNLAAVVAGGQVNLSWTDNSTVETSYYVDRSSDGTTWSSLATLAANSTAYSDANVSAGGTYYYRVWAANATSSSNYSATVQATLAPPAPAGLVLVVVSSSQINLTWNDVAGETGYRIERSTNGGGTWSQAGSVGANVTTYQNTGLAANTTYAFRVVATNAGGDSAPSSLASAATMAVPSPPAAPNGLTAVAVSSVRVNLAWNDNATTENGYFIQRSTNGGNSWKQIGQVGANVTTFADTTVAANKSYKYRVRAFNDGGNSAYSNTASVTTPKLVPPSSLAVTASSSTAVGLAWQDNGADESGFRVQRSSDGGKTWKQVGEVGADVTTFTDTTAAAGKSYKYRVRAFNDGGTSTYTNSASASTLQVVAPSGLASQAGSSAGVDLAWSDNGSDESGFRVQRSSDGGKTWKQVGEVGADVTTFTDTTVAAGKSYKYRVRAFNSGGNSAYSNTASATATTTAFAEGVATLPSQHPAAGLPIGSLSALFLASYAQISHSEVVPSCFADGSWVDSLTTSA